MDTKKKFAIVGGDMRQCHLAELLVADGHEVCAFALEKCTLNPEIVRPASLSALSERYDAVILPLPIESEPGVLNAPFAINSYLTRDIFSLFPVGQMVIGGKIEHNLFEKAGRSGIALFDYLEREEFSVSNAIPSAEGAIQIAMEELPITLHQANCLILGYGRIGKLLTHYLKAFGGKVTVSARKYSDLAWISAYGCNALNTLKLDGKLSDFDVIFNTVPAEVLNAKLLSELKESCLVLDLASKPGGIDFATAKKLGIKTIWALAIPAKAAPITAGKIIRETIYNIIDEWGVKQ